MLQVLARRSRSLVKTVKSSGLQTSATSHPLSKSRGRNFYGVANNRLDPSLNVRMIPMLQDNYCYLVIDEANQTMIVIDPAESHSLLPILSQEENQSGTELIACLTTHHHPDHTGGNLSLLESYPDLKIYGPSTESILGKSHDVTGGDSLQIGATKIDVLSTPCHTSGHVSYVINNEPHPPLLFSGDTLFVGGIGRFFEGTATTMYETLFETILPALPDSTKIYCGHEYTVSNLEFAATTKEADSEAVEKKLQWAKDLRSRGVPTIPSTLGEEKLYNPFLRVCKEGRSKADAIKMLGALRAAKNSF